MPCLRLFDILFPDAEDPGRALEVQLPGSRKRIDRRAAVPAMSERDSSNGRSEDTFKRAADVDSTPKSSQKYELSERLNEQENAVVCSLDSDEVSDQEDQDTFIDSTSADESSDESTLGQLK